MRKLILCFDGTCNEPEDYGDYFADGSISNIAKLHIFLGGQLSGAKPKAAQRENQRSFYYSGVGTRGGWFKKLINAAFAPSGSDTRDILDEAKDDIEKHYRDGDEIYIFGFSRGAAIARMFAAKLDKPIKFLGVFDTVAATKGSLDLDPDTYPASGIVFEDGTLGSHVERAVHLLSLDDKRLAFQPTLFNKDERIHEIWFSGAHSDIGGGYWYDGLSDITLKYMMESASDLTWLGIDDIEFEVKLDREDVLCRDDLFIKPLFDGKNHEQKRTKLNAKLLAPRYVRVNKNDKAIINTGENEEIWGVAKIHHTVIRRYNAVKDYRPYSLRGQAYSVEQADGSLIRAKTGVSDL